MLSKKITLLAFLVFHSLSILFSQTNVNIQGSIQNKQGKPLPWAVVVVDQLEFGAMADSAGRFSMFIPLGTHEFTARCLGHKALKFSFLAEKDTSIFITLETEAVMLDDVVIVPGEKDPAYGIIKAAIKRKKFNRRPFDQYQCEAYTKVAYGLPRDMTPARLLSELAGESEIQKDRSEENLAEIDSTFGDPMLTAILSSPIFFLSENVSTFYYQKPNKAKEIIQYSRVSGNSEQFTFLGRLNFDFDAYENKQVYEAINERGIISPISGNALFFYDYKLLGTVKKKGKKVYKIAVNPKRESDPVYRGLVYIVDSSFAMAELDLVVTKAQNIDLLDSMRIQQTFTLVNDFWMPLQLTLNQYVKFDILGLRIPIHGLSTSLTNRYRTEQLIDKKTFRGPIIAVNPEATSLAPTQWDSIRALPLNLAQEKDYRLKDRVDSIMRSPAFLDSMTKASRKMDISQFLFMGHLFRNYSKNRELFLPSPLQGIQFNPMEGISAELAARRRWGRENTRHFDVSGKIRYGFSNDRLSYLAKLDYVGKPVRYEKASLSAGSYPVQFSRFDQIPEQLNTLWALDDHVSFIRLYQKGFAELDYEREILNGFNIGTNIRYEDRFSLQNTSEFSIFGRRSKEYTKNIQIPDHQALITEFRISWQPGNKYYKGPDRKINLEPVWPKLDFVLRRAWGTISTNASDFTSISATISDKTRLGIFGNTKWSVEAGRFLQQERVYFPDLFHQKGNEIWAQGFSRFESFALLPYYSRSSTADYVQFHGEHAFEGFLFNKVPGLKKLKLKEYIGFHALWQDGQAPYAELQAGIEYRLFRILPLRLNFNFLLNGGGTEARNFGWQLSLPELPINQ